jgi:hypothetical protein
MLRDTVAEKLIQKRNHQKKCRRDITKQGDVVNAVIKSTELMLQKD